MKSMKKSMFVTTILMVVLLIVALSTATFAWYTAQSTVTVSQTLVTSATASAASLAIDTTANLSSNKSSVDITMGPAPTPMVPKAAPSVGTTTYAAFTSSANEGVGLFGAPVDIAGKFTTDGVEQTPATIASVESDSNLHQFYVINTSGTQSATVNVTVSFISEGYTQLVSKPNDWATQYATYYTKDGENYNAVVGTGNPVAAPDFGSGEYYVANSKVVAKLRVAIFGDDVYKGTWASANNAATHYGTITATNNGSGMTSYNATNAAQSFATLSARTAATCKIVAWFDGADIVVNEAGMPALFTVTFNMVE